MDDPKSIRVSVDGSVKRYERKRWHAWLGICGSHGVEGTGETEAAAREALARDLAWVGHYVGAFVCNDAEGAPWICTVGPHHGTWIVRRATSEGMSSGCSIVPAPSYSKLREQIAAWNRGE